MNILRHALKYGLKDDDLRPLGDRLCCVNDFHIVLFQHGFVLGGGVTVPGESVKLPHEKTSKFFLALSLIIL